MLKISRFATASNGARLFCARNNNCALAGADQFKRKIGGDFRVYSRLKIQHLLT
jgi:hypothetical protein